MTELKPIKRGNELKSLSREHHDGLLFCWKINTGLNRNIALDRIIAYLIYFFDNSIEAHFLEEENHVYPLINPANKLRIEAETQHFELRSCINQIRNNPKVSAETLKDFTRLLNNHIRFEERELFTTIEKEADTLHLQVLAQHLKQLKHNSKWNDQFWIN